MESKTSHEVTLALTSGSWADMQATTGGGCCCPDWFCTANHNETLVRDTAVTAGPSQAVPQN